MNKYEIVSGHTRMLALCACGKIYTNDDLDALKVTLSRCEEDGHPELHNDEKLAVYTELERYKTSKSLTSAPNDWDDIL